MKWSTFFPPKLFRTFKNQRLHFNAVVPTFSLMSNFGT